MLMFKERRPGIQTLRGWAMSVLNDAEAIRECGGEGIAAIHMPASVHSMSRDRIRRPGFPP